MSKNISNNDKVALALIKNAFIMPDTGKPLNIGSQGNLSTLFNKNAGGSFDVKKNLGNSAIPVPPLRQRQDPVSWRNAIIEAERSVIPYRTMMQVIFRDTILNPHIKACIEKRKNLTLLREFALVDEKGNKDIEWTEFLHKSWFNNFVSYSLDAKFFGYTLISLGDINQNELNELTIIRRDNISPERENVSAAPYIPQGERWDSEEYAPWHIWVSTPNENGTTSCGYGLLYYIALQEIMLRNMTSNNADFMDLFASPYRALYMDINNEEERKTAYESLENQGALGYGIFAKDDKLEVLDASKGNGYKAYADFELRMEKKISTLILGHSDAVSSVPGKLGANQGGKDSAANTSLEEEPWFSLMNSSMLFFFGSTMVYYLWLINRTNIAQFLEILSYIIRYY